MKKVYVAGLYTIGDPVENTRKAILAGDSISKIAIPYIPHISLLWHLIAPHEVEFWYTYDLHWLRVCDALWVISYDANSKGVNREIAEAKEQGLPVFFKKEELEEWLTSTVSTV